MGTYHSNLNDPNLPHKQRLRNVLKHTGRVIPQAPPPAASLGTDVSTDDPRVDSRPEVLAPSTSPRVPPDPPPPPRGRPNRSLPGLSSFKHNPKRLEGSSEHQTQTPSPPLRARASLEAHAYDLERTPSHPVAKEADVQRSKRSKSAGPGMGGTRRGLPHAAPAPIGAGESKTENSLDARLLQTGTATFPQESRPGGPDRNLSRKKVGSQAQKRALVTTDPRGITAGSASSPHSAVPPLTPHSLPGNHRLSEVPTKEYSRLPLRFLHDARRIILKNVDRILKSRPQPPETSGLSEPTGFSSVTSLPTTTSATVGGNHQSIDPKSPHTPIDSRHRIRRQLSLNELKKGLLAAGGERSQTLEALDLTGQLTSRSEAKFSGGFSDVSQAMLGDCLVAVKALRTTNHLDEARLRKRLAREIHVWAALDHPHILELLGYSFQDGVPCLISPWCEHGTLQEYLHKYHNPERPRLVREIAEGLKYLHTREPEIIHGDFKTSNVFVTGDHSAKISDFGGSRRLGGPQTGFTTTGLVLTTIRYCAPEILRDGQQHNLYSDVFSFACVALETMSGQCPFWKIPNHIAVIAQVVYEKQKPSREDHPLLQDPNLWDLLRECWNPESSDRPTMIGVCRTLAATGYGPPTPFYP